MRVKRIVLRCLPGYFEGRNGVSRRRCLWFHPNAIHGRWVRSIIANLEGRGFHPDGYEVCGEFCMLTMGTYNYAHLLIC